MIGSRTGRQASHYVARIRRSLEQRATRENAKSTLLHDFGSFRPIVKDIWRVNEFVVAQPGIEHHGEKEPSFAAYGYDSAFLGGRFDLVVWDDLVDRRALRTEGQREEMHRWWGDEAETRVEPGGLLILQGQRLDADDHYRYALDLTLEDGTPKYHHIKFPAHTDDICLGVHETSAPAWPEGCLLDPVRVPWRDLAAKKAHNLGRYLTVYQQEDFDTEQSLVQPEWIEGGDYDDVHYRGCWANRRCGMYPRIDPRQCISVVGVDPSVARNWGVSHWIYDRATEERHLIDLYCGPMSASALLDYDYGLRCFTGLMHDWQRRSIEQGFPIQAWVVEVNAAQRFLLQYQVIQRWSLLHRTMLMPHTTTVRKRDEDYGPQVLASLYRLGLVRLPGGDRAKVSPLVNDVLRWHPETTLACDSMMSSWFVECQLPNLAPAQQSTYERWRPSWVHGERGYVLEPSA
jgi:hypothetical protein